jgi:O-antigen/teichoic acid export membrane protein
LGFDVAETTSLPMNSETQPGIAGTVRGRLVRGLGATALGLVHTSAVAIKRVVRPNNQPLGDAGQRSANRYQRAALTSLTAIIARAINFASLLLTVPLTVRYLGTERYAIWATVSSFLAMATFADFGMGNGLLNAVVETYGRDDEPAARKYISSACVALSAVGAVALVTFALTYSRMPWSRLLNIHSGSAAATVAPTAAVMVVCFALALPLGIVQRVQIGLQQGWQSNLWSTMGTLMGLLGIVACVLLHADLPFLVLAASGGPVLALLLNFIDFFGRSSPQLRPRLDLVSGSSARGILQSGMLFFVLQAAMSIGMQSDNVVVARVLGLERVTDYAIPARLFAIVPGITAMLVSPLWPAYGEAFARGDARWIVRTLRSSLLLTVPVLLLSNAVLVVFGRTIIGWWAGPQIQPDFKLLLGLALSSLLLGTCATIAVFLNGINRIRFSAMIAAVMAVVNISLSILLTHRIGPAGVAYGTALSYLFCVIVPYTIYIPRLLKSLRIQPQCVGNQS